MKLNEKDIERFWSKVDKTSGQGPNRDCWLSSCKGSEYGQFSINGKPYRPSKVSWVIINGEVLNRLYILHRCDIKNCVNPSHLFLGTQADNIKDMVSKGRQGDRNQKGEKNSNSKLTQLEVNEIRKLRANGFGLTLRELSIMFRISTAQICSISKHRTWKEENA